MIIRLSSKSENGNGFGRSFRDLARYLFTGSAGENNPGRVLWAKAYNCHVSDPSQAWAEMAWTAENQEALKKDAKRRGLLKKNARIDQQEETPAWHCVISWEKGENPTPERMEAAGLFIIEKQGLRGHHFEFVVHGDGGAPHLHIMANAIDPETGLSAKRRICRVEGKRQDGQQVRLSAAALEWEMTHPDEKAAPERERNWKRRLANQAERVAYAVQQKARRAMGQKPLPPLSQQKVYDKSPGRRLYSLMRDVSQTVRIMLRGHPEAEQIAQKAAAQFRQVHGKEWGGHLAGERVAAASIASSDVGTDKEAIAAILKAATYSKSVFKRDDLIRVVRERLGDSHTPERHAALMAAVEASPDLFRSGGDGGSPERFTSREMHDTEIRMLNGAMNMAAAHSHAVGSRAAEPIRAKWAPKLNASQLAALDHVTGPQQFAVVEGLAGTGKSFMLKPAKQIWEAAGYTVHGLAYSGIAAESLQNGSDIVSRTIHAMEWALKHKGEGFGAKDIIVIDEAGMIGSRRTLRLLEIAQKAGAKIVLVGDRTQHQTMEAGGALAALADRVGAAVMNEVVRQREEWARTASVDFSAGGTRTAAALDAYAKRGHVKAMDTRDDARDAMVAEWFDHYRATRARETGVMMAATRVEVAALNELARARMQADGLLGPSRAISALIEAPDTPPQEFRLEIATGERIMFTKNDKRMDVKNGTIGTIERIDGGRITIRIDGKTPRMIVTDLAQYRNFAYGYAATTYKNQGVTADRAWFLASKGSFCDAHAAYVGMSRHRDAATLFYGRDDFANRKALLRQLSRQHLKETSLDLFDVPDMPRLRRRELGQRLRRRVLTGAYAVAARAMQGRESGSAVRPARGLASRKGIDTSRTRERD